MSGKWFELDSESEFEMGVEELDLEMWDER